VAFCPSQVSRDLLDHAANYFNVFAERELVHFMSKSSRDITKSSKKGAQATGEPVLVRVQPDMAKQLDDWR
jgi:hypothetical protein